MDSDLVNSKKRRIFVKPKRYQKMNFNICKINKVMSEKSVGKSIA